MSPSAPDSRELDGQGLLLSRTMLSNQKLPYVGRFACDWHRLATTDPHATLYQCRTPYWPGTTEPADPEGEPALAGEAPSRTVTFEIFQVEPTSFRLTNIRSTSA